MKYLIAVFVFIINSGFLKAQTDDYVDVTLYYHSDGNSNTVYLPGEFNGWALNSSSSMREDPATGIWWRTERLRVGGPVNPQGIEGAYQYKFNDDGAWLGDPLNPRFNPQDNNNSYIYINNPTIHYLLPNSTTASGIIRTRFPEITAYIFPSISSEVDTSTITISINGTQYSNIGNKYDPLSKRLSFIPPDPLPDGGNELILSVQSTTGSISADTTIFIIQSGSIQFLSLPAETWKDSWRLQGAIFDDEGGYNTDITSAQIIRSDSTWTVDVMEGIIDTTMHLLEGDNIFELSAVINSQVETSAPLDILRKIDKGPHAQIDISQDGGTLTFSAAATTHPDAQSLIYLWAEDPDNPESLGIDGLTDEEVTTAVPSTPGEYYVSLTVEDSSMNSDQSRSFFVKDPGDILVDVGSYEDNPSWVKTANIYLMFFKAFTSTGTIQAAIPNLEYVKAMGFNTIWVLPVMEIPGIVDNQINIGYSIMDFYNVETSYGANQDFKEFVAAAHEHGLKVILDVTPNHSYKGHPFAAEASAFGDYSPYWNYYQTESIPHNTNYLGECVTAEGIYYYCAFSDALLNWDWRDLDAKKYMINVYEHWVREYDIDGFRFDVYWGPHRKYGEENMGIPVREALKRIKPDILLLGEDDGVGVGTEVIYADQGGGNDASYDFKLYFDAVRGFNFSSSGVNTLHHLLNNAGYRPGENSFFLRFMESQDEDRISYVYDSFEKTMPVAAAIYTAPGMPMMFNGQEVGFGKDMGAPGEPDLNDRRRGVIDWDFEGKELLTPHYQKLAQIRAQFPAFSRRRLDTNGDGNVDSSDESEFDRVNTGNGLVYSFLRPYTDSNGLTVTNFTNLKFTDEFNPATVYWVNDHYNGTSSQQAGSDLPSFSVILPPYGTAIYTISTEEEMVVLPPLPPIVSVKDELASVPENFILKQNYPNPFNPSTIIEFAIPAVEKGYASSPNNVKLVVYDILGREVGILVNEYKAPGNYRVEFDASSLSSGVYFYSLQSGSFAQVKKMVLLR
jgi:glycosidase